MGYLVCSSSFTLSQKLIVGLAHGSHAMRCQLTRGAPPRPTEASGQSESHPSACNGDFVVPVPVSVPCAWLALAGVGESRHGHGVAWSPSQVPCCHVRSSLGTRAILPDVEEPAEGMWGSLSSFGIATLSCLTAGLLQYWYNTVLCCSNSTASVADHTRQWWVGCKHERKVGTVITYQISSIGAVFLGC